MKFLFISLSLSLSLSHATSRSRQKFRREERREENSSPLSLRTRSLFSSLSLLTLPVSLSRDGEFPSRGELFSLFSLSRNGNDFRRARGVPSFPLFLSFLSSPSLSPSLSDDGNFRRENFSFSPSSFLLLLLSPLSHDLFSLFSLSRDGNKFRRARGVLSSRAPLLREREK